MHVLEDSRSFLGYESAPCNLNCLYKEEGFSLSLSSPLSPNWDKTDWESLEDEIRSFTVSDPPLSPTPASLESWFQANYIPLCQLLVSHTPA